MRAYGEALPSLPLSYAKIVRKDRTFYDPADRKKKQTIRRVRQEYGLILPFRSVGNEHKEQTVMSVLMIRRNWEIWSIRCSAKCWLRIAEAAI